MTRWLQLKFLCVIAQKHNLFRQPLLRRFATADAKWKSESPTQIPQVDRPQSTVDRQAMAHREMTDPKKQEEVLCN